MEAWAIQTGVQLCFIRPAGLWRMASSRALTDGFGMNASMWNGLLRYSRPVKSWQPGAITTTISGHIVRWTIGRRPICESTRGPQTALRLSHRDQTNRGPRQGFASPAGAALDPSRGLSEDINDQGEALLRIAQSRGSLLSLWSIFRPLKWAPEALDRRKSQFRLVRKRVAGQSMSWFRSYWPVFR